MSSFPPSPPAEVFPPADSPSPDEAPPPKRGWLRWATRLVFVLLVASLVIPLSIHEFPDEVGRWHHAAALEQYYDGQMEQAIATLGKALEWSPENAEYHLLRATWRQEAGQYRAALADADRALELNAELLQVYETRSLIHLLLDEPESAVGELRLLRNAMQKRGIPVEPALNELAYYRALTGLELKAGLADAQQAVALLGGDLAVARHGGELLYRLERPRAAVRQFDRGVELVDAELDRRRQRLQTARQAQAFLGDLLDVKLIEEAADSAAAPAARMHYYRSLAHQALGNAEQAKADLARTRDLGGKPEELSKSLGEIQEARLADLCMRAGDYAAYIDTRGYLHYRLGNHEAALRDLTTAIDLGEAQRSYLLQSPAYTQEISYRFSPAEARHQQRQQDKSIAVIRYHRALAYEALGETDRAERDLKRVRELGFEPGPDLF
jgi:tetratricopeptide (TPR) repeat protein